MPRKNTIVPIEAFDPRLRQLLVDGSVKRMEVPCTSSSQRTALRNQLFDYRARAREQKLEGATQLYRAKVTFGATRGEGEERVWPLVIAPRGSEFDDVLGKAEQREAAPTIATLDPLDDLKVEE
jgi:hypothetical protein